jgi:HEPN domain-containing protein
VEKYLKALLTLKQIEFAKTHDLTELVWLLPAELGLRPYLEALSELNRYAVETRYPGEWEPITREEAEAAVKLALEVRHVIRTYLPDDVTK